MAEKRKVQVRYGAAADRPTLSTAEFGLDTDTGSEKVYIGTPAGNKLAANLAIKDYACLITQSGTSAPTVTELDNTTGATVTPTYTQAGVYTLTFSSAVLTANKTIITAPGVTQGTSDRWRFLLYDYTGSVVYSVAFGLVSTSALQISVHTITAFTGGTETATNGVLTGMYFALKIYP